MWAPAFRALEMTGQGACAGGGPCTPWTEPAEHATRGDPGAWAAPALLARRGSPDASQRLVTTRPRLWPPEFTALQFNRRLPRAAGPR